MFLQMSIDKALSQLLFFACQQRKQDLLVTLGSFESLGWKLAGTPRGVVSLQLGERGLLLSCGTITGVLITEPQPTCCGNFPINVSSTSGFKVLYVSPITRRISKTCSEVECNREHPMTLNIGKNQSVCFMSDGILPCNGPRVIEPGTILKGFKLETLSRGRSMIGSSFRLTSELKRIICDTI